jgi:hypothetical protein
MGCALSIQQKECLKSLGCALYIGARYLPENTVILSVPQTTNAVRKNVLNMTVILNTQFYELPKKRSHMIQPA